MLPVLHPTAEKLPPWSQVIRGLLAADRTSTANALNNLRTEALVDNLKNEIENNRFSVLVADKLAELKLEDEFSRLPGQPLIWLRRLAAADYLSHELKSGTVDEVITALRGLQVVFVKGIVTGRTLYQKPAHRLSYDIDLIVRASDLQEVTDRLRVVGYRPRWRDCHQMHLGPCGEVSDLFLSPDKDLDYFFGFTMACEGKPAIEFKPNPLDTALKMHELERFFSNTITVSDGMLAPDIIDHLMLQLMHLHKDKLAGWRSISDAKLLCEEVSRIEGWNEFLRRCLVENVQVSCLLSLNAVNSLFPGTVPALVLSNLSIEKYSRVRQLIAACCSPEFVWHKRMLPGLLLSALVLGDTKRKLEVLSRIFFPSDQFICKYYVRGNSINKIRAVFLRFFHFLVCILPGGLIRRTVGPAIWPVIETEGASSRQKLRADDFAQ